MIYVSSSCIKQKRIDDVIKHLADAGIKNIELSGGTEYYDGIESDLKSLKDIYDLNYVCHAYFPPPKNPFVVNLASCNDSIYYQSIEHYAKCIDMLKRIECKVLSVHAGFLVEIGSDEIGGKLSGRIVYDEAEAYDRFCSAYRYISRRCNENNIKLYLENNVLSLANYEEFGFNNYMMMTDYSSIMKMKEQLDFNLLLDLGHLYVSANTLGLKFGQECSGLSKCVDWIHISENNGIRDEHKPLRKNSDILQEFGKIYKRGINVTLEAAGSIDEITTCINLLQPVD